MPRFFMHSREAERLIEDPDGSNLPDLDAAREEAAVAAREIAAERLRAGEPLDARRFEIHDEGRAVAGDRAVPGGARPAVTRPEPPLSRAERRVREGEERVARQAALVETLSETGHGWAAETARIMLATFETSLELARDRLRAVRARADGGLPPPPH